MLNCIEPHSERAEAVREKVAHCPKSCWMIGSVSPVMKKYLPHILPWIVKNKLRTMYGGRVDTECIPFYHVGNNDLQGLGCAAVEEKEERQ